MNRFKFRALLTPVIELEDNIKEQVCFYIDDISIDSEGYSCFSTDEVFTAVNEQGYDLDMCCKVVRRMNVDNTSSNKDSFIIKTDYCIPEQVLQSDTNDKLIFENDIVTDGKDFYTVKWSEKKLRFILVDEYGNVKSAKKLKKYELFRNSLENVKLHNKLNEDITEYNKKWMLELHKTTALTSLTITKENMIKMKEILYANDFKPISAKTANEILTELTRELADWQLYGDVSFENNDGFKEIRVVYKNELVGVMAKGNVRLNFENFTFIPDEG